MSTSKTSKANNPGGTGKTVNRRETSLIAPTRASTPACPQARVTLILILALAASAAGCRAHTPQVKYFAEKFLGYTAGSYKKLQSVKTRIASCKTNCDQPGSLEENPAFALLVNSKETLDMYSVRRREYLSAIKDKKQNPADVEVENKLEAVRDAFALCALRVTIDLKDKLPAYSVWQGAAPDTIVAKSRESLGLKPGAPPPASACANYEKLSAETYKLLKLQPAAN